MIGRMMAKMEKETEGKNKERMSVFALLMAVSLLLCLIMGLYPRKYSDIVERYAGRYGLEPSLVYAVIKTESGYRSDALSVKGAKGLMQIMDRTGEWGFAELGKEMDFRPELLFVPEINIEIGCWYLNKLINQFESEDTALAAYNAGSGNVSGWLENPEYFNGYMLYNIPFVETRNYVRKVNSSKRIYEQFRGANKTALATTGMVAETEPGEALHR